MRQPFALGFDLGGTQVRGALVQAGRVVRRAALRTDAAGGPEAVMQQVRSLAEQVAGGESPMAVGIAAPGPLDTETGIVDNIPTLKGWDGFPLRDRLAQAFACPAAVENDGIAAAHGEWQYGAGRGLQHMVYTTISTGIGGGVFMDGRLLHGRRGMGAHVGHFRMAESGPQCTCGRMCCFEAFASGTALGRRAKEAASRDSRSYLGKIAGERAVDARDVVDGARCGDALCMSLLADEARYLGQGFASLAHLYAPQRIIMGGGVAQAFDLLIDDIRATFAVEAIPSFRDVEIVPAALGDNAGLIGAADLAMKLPRH